jgi:flagellar secretion chaperone FliS
MQTMLLEKTQFQNSYQENQVYTASREELILMLYDGALRFINMCIQCYDDKDIPKAEWALVRAEKIVHYLDLILDMDGGREVAKNLDRLYHFINNRLADSLNNQNKVPATEAMEILTTLRNAWKETFAK